MKDSPFPPDEVLPDSETILERIAALRGELTDILRRNGRNEGAVRIIAVTKTHPLRAMTDALAGGLADMGENRVQEFVPKIEAIRAGGYTSSNGQAPRFHLIGHLQSNKAKQVVAAGIDLIHSLDSVDLAKEINRRAGVAGRIQDVLVQVNVSGEGTKSGFDPAEVEPALEEMTASCGHLRICGYMTMAPFEYEAEATRPVFERLRQMADRLNSRFKGAENFRPTHMSMGMTNDWRQAVEEGATLIRVGSALFGPRG